MTGIEESTLHFIKQLLPGFEPVIATRTPSPHLEVESILLPIAPGSDYGFVLSFCSGEWQIGARPVQCPDTGYFWYRPYEHTEFGGSVEKSDAAFRRDLVLLLTRETRIIQRNGILSCSFRCEYIDGESWRKIYGLSAFKFGGFKFPKIQGRVHTYHSGVIARPPSNI